MGFFGVFYPRLDPEVSRKNRMRVSGKRKDESLAEALPKSTERPHVINTTNAVVFMLNPSSYTIQHILIRYI